MTPAGLLNSSQNYSQCCSIFNKPNQKPNHYDCIKIIHCNKYTILRQQQLHYYGKSTPLGYLLLAFCAPLPPVPATTQTANPSFGEGA